MTPILSVLICTLPERVHKLNRLLEKLMPQVDGKPVEVLFLGDIRSRSIGQKRNELVGLAKGDYVCFIDDDDMISDDYIDEIIKALSDWPDCVVFDVEYTEDGKNPRNVRYDKDFECDKNFDDRFERLPNHLMVILRRLASGKFPDISIGEDFQYAKNILPMLRSQHRVNKVLYHYLFSNPSAGVPSRSRFFGAEMSQHKNMPAVMNDFLSMAKPNTIIEIGTFHGGLAILFQIYAMINKANFVTYDIQNLLEDPQLFNELGIERRYSDVFSHGVTKEIISSIENGGTTVLFCDGGDKIREFNIFAYHLKKGDFILAHDYAPDFGYFDRNLKGKIWDWCEIIDDNIKQACEVNGLKKFHLEFQSVACTCWIKS